MDLINELKGRPFSCRSLQEKNMSPSTIRRLKSPLAAVEGEALAITWGLEQTVALLHPRLQQIIGGD